MSTVREFVPLRFQDLKVVDNGVRRTDHPETGQLRPLLVTIALGAVSRAGTSKSWPRSNTLTQGGEPTWTDALHASAPCWRTADRALSPVTRTGDPHR